MQEASNEWFWCYSIVLLFVPPCFHCSSPCLLRMSWWSPPSPPPSSPRLSLQRRPLWPPPSQSIPQLSLPPRPSSVTPHLSLLPCLTIHARRPPQPSSQPPSCVPLLGQSELTRDRFSSHRTNDNVLEGTAIPSGLQGFKPATRLSWLRRPDMFSISGVRIGSDMDLLLTTDHRPEADQSRGWNLH